MRGKKKQKKKTSIDNVAHKHLLQRQLGVVWKIWKCFIECTDKLVELRSLDLCVFMYVYMRICVFV
jgi:hypothetical protein